MHVAFFEFFNHFGGAQRSTVELAARLAPHIKVSIIDPYGCCEPFIEAVHRAGLDHHVLIPGTGARYIGGRGRPLQRTVRLVTALPDLHRVRARAKSLLRKLDPSVICVSSFKSAGLVGTISGLKGIPLALFFRGWFTPDMIPPYGGWILRNCCSGFLAVSNPTKAAVVRAGVPSAKISVLHNPIDVEATSARADLPLDAPLPQDKRPVRLLLPARILRGKGQHTAIEAMRIILDRGHDAVLWLAGDYVAIGDNKTYLRDIRRLAEDLGVADHVEWLGLRDDVPQLMKRATIVILPTHTEGLSRTVMEALSLGRPVATTPVGGMPDLILADTTGVYFEPDDPAGLAERVSGLVKDPAFAERIGRQAREHMRLNFAADDLTQRALRVFERLSERRLVEEAAP